MKSNVIRYSIFLTLSLTISLIVWFYAPLKFTFAEPNWLYLIWLAPLITTFLIWQEKRKFASIKLSSVGFLSLQKSSLFYVLNYGFYLIKIVSLVLFVLALARPQSNKSWQDITREGIDIIISLDVSGSMLAKDFEPNRLEASKEISAKFISERPNDRLGLVVYEGEAFTQCPLTTDHRVLIDLTNKITTGLIEGGTAIGLGLATAVNRLKESEAESKVIILLSDGENNAGSVAPLTAAEIAQSFNIRVYTIGVGTKGLALSPVAMYGNGQYKYDYTEVNIDEELLTDIAQLTGGQYFRATNNKSLEEIYKEIDRLEKTRINVTEHVRYKDEYLPFVFLATLLLAFEFLGRTVLLKTVS